MVIASERKTTILQQRSTHETRGSRTEALGHRVLPERKLIRVDISLRGCLKTQIMQFRVLPSRKGHTMTNRFPHCSVDCIGIPSDVKDKDFKTRTKGISKWVWATVQLNLFRLLQGGRTQFSRSRNSSLLTKSQIFKIGHIKVKPDGNNTFLYKTF